MAEGRPWSGTGLDSRGRCGSAAPGAWCALQRCLHSTQPQEPKEYRFCSSLPSSGREFVIPPFKDLSFPTWGTVRWSLGQDRLGSAACCSPIAVGRCLQGPSSVSLPEQKAESGHGSPGGLRGEELKAESITLPGGLNPRKWRRPGRWGWAGSHPQRACSRLSMLVQALGPMGGPAVSPGLAT